MVYSMFARVDCVLKLTFAGRMTDGGLVGHSYNFKNEEPEIMDLIVGELVDKDLQCFQVNWYR